MDESVFLLEFIIDEKLLKEEVITHIFIESHERAKIFISSIMTATGKRKLKYL